MAYNNYSEQTMPANDIKAPTFFNSLGSELSGAIGYQANIIIDIQSRLHGIINRLAPTTNGEVKNQNPPADAAEELMREVGKLQNNNAALEKILNHLSEII